MFPTVCLFTGKYCHNSIVEYSHDSFSQLVDLRTSVIVGGDSMESQFEELAECPDIIIATPGRLMHHLNDVKDDSSFSAICCV